MNILRLISRSAPRWSIAAAAMLASTAVAQPTNPPSRTPPPMPNPLRFQLLGPAEGGRVASIVGVPGDAKTWYLGNASGGVWKSSDSGKTFIPVSDSMPVQAIGALAIAPSNPLMVWAGTGEAWAIRDADVMGDGIYLSSDSGHTWTNMGLRETGRIGRIIVHPTNPDIVFACALGRVTGPQQERGVYRTTDGGKTWSRVLFVDPNTGCSGLTMDPKHPETLFAGMWQVEMHTWGMFGGGPSSAIYASHDGGTTWTKVADPGLPHEPLGKIDVAIAPSDGNRVYALIQTADQGSLWRSDDGGATWHAQNWTRALIGRAGYYIRLAVGPTNPDEILLANSSFFRSMDGGKTFREVPWGGDNHDIWIDPMNPDRFGLTNDADARLTTNHGRTWTNASLPNGQMYHVAIDDRVPYWIYTNRQDDGTMRGPSTTPEATSSGRPVGLPPRPPGGGRFGAGRGPADSILFRDDSIRAAGGVVPVDTAAVRDSVQRAERMTRARANGDTTAADSAAAGAGGGGFGGFRGSEWEHGLGGCESGFTIPDYVNTDIVWSTCYGNTVTRYDAKTKLARSVSPGIHTLDSPPTDVPYRCHWTPPLAIDPFDHNTVYYGCQVVFSTSNGGETWKVISPDLSTRDSSRIVFSGGIVGDNLGQFYGEVVFAIAPSPVKRGLLWAGTNDGKLWYTPDHGGNWVDVTKGLTSAGLPAWGTIRKIEPSHFDAATAYVAVDFHMMDDRKPYIYKTTDYGKTWTNITGDLPADHPLDYVMAVTENPNKRGMLFAGTGHGFFYSMNDGGHWAKYADGLPAAPVTWIVVSKRFHDVIASTYGRGIFVLRDITPLETGGSATPVLAAGEAAKLYPPQPGYRQARSGHADVTFAVAESSRKPVKVEIFAGAAAAGAKPVRTLSVRTREGLNRATWDLRYDPPKRVDLRTVAPENPHIWEEPRFKGKTVRPITHWGIQEPETTGPLAAPGRYTVRLTVDGRTSSVPLTILRDAAIVSPDSALIASTAFQVKIRDAMDTTVVLINKLETMRHQIEEQRAANAGKDDVLSALDDLDAKMLAVEHQLVSKQDLNSDDKYYVVRNKVYLDLVWLNAEVGTGGGDVAGGADYRPTAASRATFAGLEAKLAKARADFATLMKTTVPAFNKTMAGKVGAIAEK